MSRSLHYTVVPVEPTVIDNFGELEPLILQALNLDDPFDQITRHSLHGDPIRISHRDPAATYLRGCLAAMPGTPAYAGLRDDLTNFLATLDNQGALMIGAS